MIESNRTGRGLKAVLLALLMLACVIAGASMASEDADAATCPTCGGDKVYCSTCYNTGFYHDDGENECPDCDGRYDLRDTCLTCNGTGTVADSGDSGSSSEGSSSDGSSGSSSSGGSSSGGSSSSGSSVTATFDAGDGDTVSSDYSGRTDDEAIADTYTVGDTIDLSDYDAAKVDSNGYSYVLSGWKCSNGTTYGTTDKVTITSKLTFTAQFSATAKTYTVTLNADGGTFGSGSTKTVSVTYGSAYSALSGVTDPTKTSTSTTSYTFAGWYTSATGGTQVTASTVCSNASNHTLYAHWTESANTVGATFDAGDGDTISSDYSGRTDDEAIADTYTVGDTIDLSDYDAAKVDSNGYSYVLSGWKCSNGTTYGTTDKVTITSKLTFTAQFSATAKVYTVTYNANGGVLGSVPSSEKVTATGSSTSYTVSSYKPTNDANHKTFNVWTVSGRSSDTWVVAGGTITITGDVTLTAAWKDTKYDVTMRSESGVTISFEGYSGLDPESSMTGTLQVESVGYGETVDLSNYDAVKNSTSTPVTGGTETTEYRLTGWKCSDGEIYGTSAVVTITSDTTFTAVFSPVKTVEWNVYTVIFKSNGGTGSMSPLKISYDEGSKELTANAFERTGYTFDGWATSSAGAVVYKDGQSVDCPADGGTLTLYAHWKSAEYAITFHANNGTASKTTQTIMYSGGPTALKANQFTYTGHTFVGWAESAEGDKAYSDGQKVSCPSDGGTLDLYAVWEVSKFTITFKADSAKGSVSPVTLEGVEYGTEIEAGDIANELVIGDSTIVATSSDGYAFKTWINHTGMITADRTIEASFAAVTGFTVDPTAVGTTASPFVEGSEKKLTATVSPSSVKDSIEWTTSDDGIVRIDGPTTGTAVTIIAVSEGTATVTAKVAGLERTCTVTVTALSVEFTSPSGDSVRKETTDIVDIAWRTNAKNAPVLKVLTSDGEAAEADSYTWTGDADGGKLIFNVEGTFIVKAVVANGEKTTEDSFTAEIAPKEYQYVVQFYDGEKLLKTDNTPGKTTETSMEYTIKSIDLGVSEKEAQCFKGWNAEGSTELKKANEGILITPDTNPLKLYANWDFAPSLKYSAVGAEAVPNGWEETFHTRESHDVDIAELEPRKDGFAFLGWAEQEGGDAVYRYGSETLRTSVEVGYNEDKVLYAVWAEKYVYGVEYVADDASPEIPKDTYESIEQTTHVVDIVETEPVSDFGYIFVGWAASENGEAVYRYGSETLKTSVEVGYNEVKTLYAVWQVRVSYDAGEGVLTDKDPTYDDVMQGHNVVLPSATREDAREDIEGGYTVTKFTLLGWAEDANETDPDRIALPGATYKAVKSLTLCAVWQAGDSEKTWYTITFHPNADGALCDVEGWEGVMESLPSAVWDSVKSPVEGGYTVTGHVLKGWAEDAEETDPEKIYAPESRLVPTEDTDLYAIWEMSDGETVWFKVVYDANGGSEDPKDAEGIIEGLPSISREASDVTIGCGHRTTSYELLGWSVHKDAEQPDEGLTPGSRFVPTEDVELHAVWGVSETEDVFWTLTYDADIEGVDTVTEEFDSEAEYRTVSAQDFVCDGKKIIGWSVYAKAESAEYLVGGRIVLTEDTVLHAVWADADAEVVTTTIILDYNGGTGAADRLTDTRVEPSDIAFVLPADVPSKSGCSFGGWVLSSEQDGTRHPAGDTVTVAFGATVTAKAVWTCTVIFDAAGGSEAGYRTVDQGASIVLPSTERDGYSFAGWYLDGVLFGGSDKSVVIESSMCLTAHWKESEGGASEDDGDDGSGGSIAAAVGLVAVAAVFIGIAAVWRIYPLAIPGAALAVLAALFGTGVL